VRDVPAGLADRPVGPSGGGRIRPIHPRLPPAAPRSTRKVTMLAEYLPLVLLFAVAFAFVVLSLLVSSKLGPRKPNPTKVAAYESGIIPEASTDPKLGRFSVKFYLVAMLFIIFDVEAVFLYPWAVVLGDLGWYGFWVMAIFVLLLFESYYYVLRRGGLEWD
jgi:NADH-quinone oxidoreductase subunit A